MTDNFDEALETFVESAQSIVDANQREWYPKMDNIVRRILEVKVAQKYVKIFAYDENRETGERHSGSIWAFIDKSNGDILKPASLTKPAKHARGNLFDEYNGLRNVDAYGPSYMDGMVK